MNSGEKTDLRRKRTDFVKSASVNTLAVVNKPAANNVFLELIDGLVDFENIVGVDFVEFFVNGGDNGLKSGVTDILIVGVEGFSHILNGKVLDCVKELVGNLDFLILELRLADFGNNGVDEIDHFDVLLMSGHNGLEHGFVVNLVCAGFNHNNLFVGGADDEVQVGFGLLLGGGVQDDFAVHKGNLAACDRTVPRNIGDSGRHGGAEHTADCIGVVRVNGKCGHNHGAVVTHILGEKRAHGAVDNAAVKNGAVGGTTLSSGEGAGDFAH